MTINFIEGLKLNNMHTCIEVNWYSRAPALVLSNDGDTSPVLRISDVE